MLCRGMTQAWRLLIGWVSWGWAGLLHLLLQYCLWLIGYTTRKLELRSVNCLAHPWAVNSEVMTRSVSASVNNVSAGYLSCRNIQPQWGCGCRLSNLHYSHPTPSHHKNWVRAGVFGDHTLHMSWSKCELHVMGQWLEQGQISLGPHPPRHLGSMGGA